MALDYELEEKRLVRKVDWILMPILTITLGLQYYDKAVLGNAAVFGILQDLDLIRTVNGVTSTARYSTATAAFYWGYIVAVLPMALIFARAPLTKTCALVVFVWGIVCILTVVCHNFAGFVAQRFFLGLMESAVSPAFVMVTCLWYKPSEQAVRMGIWYSATGIFSMISGLINYGLGHNSLPKQWQALYYFCGAVTIAWSVPIYFLMPTSPLDAGRFFNEREKEILRRRFQENPLCRDRQPFIWSQFKEAMLDWKTYLYLVMSSAIYLCNGAITAFGARIINGFGYTPLETTALLIPGGAVTCVTIYLFTYLASRFPDSRCYMLALSCVPVVVGAITIWQAPLHPTAGPLIGYYLVAAFGAPYVLLLSVASANTAGSTKKAVIAGTIFMGYNVGNIAAAYTVIASEVSLKYRSTWITVISAMAFTILASFALRFGLMRANKQSRISGAAPQVPETPMIEQTHGAGEKVVRGEEQALGYTLDSVDKYEDRTDRQIPGFRYAL